MALLALGWGWKGAVFVGRRLIDVVVDSEWVAWLACCVLANGHADDTLQTIKS